MHEVFREAGRKKLPGNGALVVFKVMTTASVVLRRFSPKGLPRRPGPDGAWRSTAAGDADVDPVDRAPLITSPGP